MAAVNHHEYVQPMGTPTTDTAATTDNNDDNDNNYKKPSRDGQRVILNFDLSKLLFVHFYHPMKKI